MPVGSLDRDTQRACDLLGLQSPGEQAHYLGLALGQARRPRYGVADVDPPPPTPRRQQLASSRPARASWPERARRPATGDNASRCGRGSVFVWYASAAASRQAAGEREATRPHLGGNRCRPAARGGRLRSARVWSEMGNGCSTRSVWYACSRTRSHSSGVKADAFCQTRTETPTRPTSCTNAARRIAVTSAGGETALLRCGTRKLRHPRRVTNQVLRQEISKVTHRRERPVNAVVRAASTARQARRQGPHPRRIARHRASRMSPASRATSAAIAGSNAPSGSLRYDPRGVLHSADHALQRRIPSHVDYAQR